MGETLSIIKLRHVYILSPKGYYSNKLTYNDFSVDIELRKYDKFIVFCPFCDDKIELTIYPPISLANSIELSLHSDSDKGDFIHPRNLFIADVIVLPIWILLFQRIILLPGWIAGVLGLVSLFCFWVSTETIYEDMRTQITYNDLSSGSGHSDKHIILDYYIKSSNNNPELRIPYYK
jgi:hypothetical protein